MTSAGIPINIHGTFAVLFFFLLVIGLAAGREIAAAASSALFLLTIFIIIVPHEFGHGLTAGQFGVKNRDVTLIPIGGRLVLSGWSMCLVKYSTSHWRVRP